MLIDGRMAVFLHVFWPAWLFTWIFFSLRRLFSLISTFFLLLVVILHRIRTLAYRSTSTEIWAAVRFAWKCRKKWLQLIWPTFQFNKLFVLPMSLLVCVCIHLFGLNDTVYGLLCAFILPPLRQTNENLSFFFCFNRFGFVSHSSALIQVLLFKRDQLYI